MVTRLIQKLVHGALSPLATAGCSVVISLMIVSVPGQRVLAQTAGEASVEVPSSSPDTLVPPQYAPAVLGLLEAAFARGDAGAIMRHSARRVDVTLFGSSELFSRSQAGYVLKAFFNEYRPERLLLNERSASEGNWFVAGRYWYEAAESPLAVYLRVRRTDSGWELRDVRIGRSIDR